MHIFKYNDKENSKIVFSPDMILLGFTDRKKTAAKLERSHIQVKGTA